MSFGLFDEEMRLRKISKLGDNLEKLNKVVDWEIFREPITKIFEKENRGIGGRPAFDYIMMFKILILQRIYNLSDDKTELFINDSLRFMRFLGLTLSDNVPDSKTIWHFRNELAKSEIGKELFDEFNKIVDENFILLKEGAMVDATFVDIPKQHNTKEEYEQIKEGKIPCDWSENKIAQKDTDARWAKKGDEVHDGYKDHVKADVATKFILDYTITPASVHDSNEIGKLVKSGDKCVYADAGYVGKEDELPKDVMPIICAKGFRNKPLTEEQKESNKMKSKIRSRVEHIFGFMTNSLHGLNIKSKGIKRATFNISLINLIYNMFRFEILTR